MAGGRALPIAISVLGLIGLVGAAIWFGVRPAGPPAMAPAPTDAGAATRLAESQPAPAAVEPTKNDGTKPSQAVHPAQTAPSFDIVRVEPSGESVIAGRATPGSTVELLRNGKPHARVASDPSGLFAFVPPPFPAGSQEVGLQAIAPDGTKSHSRETVTIVVAENKTTKPLIALTTPDKPTVLLSSPDDPGGPSGGKVATSGPSAQVMVALPPAATSAPPPASVDGTLRQGAGSTPATPPPAGARPQVRVASVEAEEGGRLFVSGQAAPGATVRLYLNDTFVAPGGAGPDGRISFVIGRGVRPGGYRVRLDDVDPFSGNVKSRAEVEFRVPPTIMVELPPAAQPFVSTPPASGPQRADVPPKASAFSSSARTAESSPGLATEPAAVMVPELNTAVVSRGDTLWRISKRVYGQGVRYTVIYGANQQQIRKPGLIYPGQVFVLPGEETRRSAR